MYVYRCREDKSTNGNDVISGTSDPAITDLPGHGINDVQSGRRQSVLPRDEFRADEVRYLSISSPSVFVCMLICMSVCLSLCLSIDDGKGERESRTRTDCNVVM